MASKELLKSLNDQFNFELLSGYHYMEMAAYCSNNNMDGFAHFFIEQAKEEYFHAMKFYNFILDIDGEIKTQDIKAAEGNYKSFVDVFKAALAHEELVTSKIEDLMELAEKERSYNTIQFLQWFIEEQREEENTMKDIVFKLENMNNFQGLYMLDRELGSRESVTEADFETE